LGLVIAGGISLEVAVDQIPPCYSAIELLGSFSGPSSTACRDQAQPPFSRFSCSAPLFHVWCTQWEIPPPQPILPISGTGLDAHFPLRNQHQASLSIILSGSRVAPPLFLGMFKNSKFVRRHLLIWRTDRPRAGFVMISTMFCTRPE